MELLFHSKAAVKASGDARFLQYAFDQINAIAKTISDAIETTKQTNQQLEGSLSDLKVAETELLRSMQSMVQKREGDLLDAISDVGLFPRHALKSLPERDAMEDICPYCSGAFLANAFVLLSCGCRYHPPCMRALILKGQMNCKACGARPHGTWMAYWGFPLNSRMMRELEA